MQPSRLLALLPGLAYLAVAVIFAGAARRAFLEQPKIVLARHVRLFDDHVVAVGGAHAVRRGVAIDIGLLLFLTMPVAIILSQTQHAWLILVPLSGAVLDTTEDVLLLAILRKGATHRDSSFSSWWPSSSSSAMAAP